jgi:hypothetical protein
MLKEEKKSSGHAGLLLRAGDMVIAVRTIRVIEDGYPECILAKPGELGQVVHLGDLSWPTIRFESGVGDCVPGDEVVRWSAHDMSVQREVARG